VNDSGITIMRSAVGSPAAAALIHELKKEGVRVIGLDCNPLSAGFYLSDKFYVIPNGDAPGFLGKILRICEIERPKAILSGPEEELLVLSKNKQLFMGKGVLVLCPDYKTVRICTDKLETWRAFNSYGVPAPEVYSKDKARFPCIVKPRFGRGGKDVFRVEDRLELELYLRKIQQPIIQEFVDGTEYTVDILADLGAKPLSIVPRIRLQVESGISMKGMTVYNEEIIAYCRKIAGNLKLIGPSCIQCIRNNSGVKFTEVNPRFGGGSALSIKADPTIVPNLIRMIKGENPAASVGFKRGLTMLRYYSEVFVTDKERLSNSRWKR
jgi:carbamoyl-phosphate synthase large subunit